MSNSPKNLHISAPLVTLCEMVNQRTSANVKFDGVSRVLNIKFVEDCITTWKAYGIRPGRTVKLRKFTRCTNNTSIPRLSTRVEDVVVDKFTSFKSPLTNPETMTSSHESGDDTASSQLFFLPRRGLQQVLPAVWCVTTSLGLQTAQT